VGVFSQLSKENQHEYYDKEGFTHKIIMEFFLCFGKELDMSMH
jgi:hypothetical protein